MTTNTAPRSFWIISIAALIWNLLGLLAFTMQLIAGQENLGRTEEQTAIYAATPSWMYIVFGIATIGGTLGCIALLMKSCWAKPILLASLIAAVIQMGYTWFATDSVAAFGTVEGIVLPAMVIVIAFVLYRYAIKAIREDWIH